MGGRGVETGDRTAAVRTRLLGPDDWRELRAVRLEALRESPWAFGSTYARESAFTEADWRRRLSAGGATFLAYRDDDPATAVGISGGFFEESTPDTAELVSMWVRPEARGSGVADALVRAVLDWAVARGAARVHLWVTATNERARRFYERLGFVPTDERQPLPSDPTLDEIGMVRPLS
ncbi:GNAT family N-acetyltransferase [Thermasporomyces composti]|jgi:ribosomal protein S18 acetylase RimI-like enzyme|uniref:Ribosomal protein S18 acetylase RimI-like enzyme n=1 Tax=Thermasporomyces composti TaxID=696763 RepID=A0A3D9VFZ4_THECX|nr:GNAT family N-acetyltransferase [Thermasporomyces composti]REF37074.1 ribosomal protein S18 acetylase RimI-like enzyme [Thermasporomyces composti]